MSKLFKTATYRQLVWVGKTAEDLLLELGHGGVQGHAALLLRQPHAGRDHLEPHRAGHGDTRHVARASSVLQTSPGSEEREGGMVNISSQQGGSSSSGTLGTAAAGAGVTPHVTLAET